MEYSLVSDKNCGSLNMFMLDLIAHVNEGGSGIILAVNDRPYYKQLALELGSEDFLLDALGCRVQASSDNQYITSMLITQLSFNGRDIAYSLNDRLLGDLHKIKNLFKVD